MRKNSLPTKSSPCPPSTTFPSANSSSSVNMSANRASSAILLKMTLISSGVIGGGSEAAAAVGVAVAVEAAEVDGAFRLAKETEASVAALEPVVSSVDIQVALE